MRSQIKIIEEKGIINVDEYLESVQQAKTDIDKLNEELNSFVLELLRSVRSIGDDDFYKSVKDEITNISGQIDHALNNLNVMEKELKTMQRTIKSQRFRKLIHTVV